MLQAQMAGRHFCPACCRVSRAMVPQWEQKVSAALPVILRRRMATGQHGSGAVTPEAANQRAEA